MGPKTLASTDAPGAGLAGDGAVRRFLRRVANVALGVAVGGIPLALYDFDGIGLSVTFGGFVTYLLLSDLRSRL